MMPSASVLDAQPTSAQRSPLRPQPQVAHLRILVADDQTDVIEAVRLLLEPDGLTTIGATTPAQALELARTHRVHAALVDLNF